MMIVVFLILFIVAVSYPQTLDRQFFEFESLLQKNALRYKKQTRADEVIYAHRNLTLRVEKSNNRVSGLSAWIVPRRDYRENKQTLDFLSSAVRVFCKAKDHEVSRFVETISYSITHTKSTSIDVGTCKGELRHVIEMM
ncbi:hypothetical protein, partial [Acinetobacter baumannii]|uniref:hypothetical protein n=1 Tax=Acinetobacter baumannii TaxID=470 RepID=UPI001BB463B8